MQAAVSGAYPLAGASVTNSSVVVGTHVFIINISIISTGVG